MPTLFCNTCNTEFTNEKNQKSHYRSEWHQYNLKRKLAGAPGVSEAAFILRLETLATEKGRLDAENLLYSCSVCHKEYRSSKAHAQHLGSRLHIQKASLWSKSHSGPITVMRPAPCRLVEDNRGDCQLQVNENSSDEWEEVNDDDVLSLDSDEVDALDEGQRARILNQEDLGYWNANQCFFCDSIPDGTVDGCVEHMHKQHGFFLPDAEYLKDTEGLLCYLGMKVMKDFTCLYCGDQGKQFSSLEAVRKHMISKSHCKLRYRDENQEKELENFYDFTSSYLPEEDAQLVSEVELATSPVSLSPSGAELIIKHYSGRKQGVKTIGSREFQRYYKQKPRPSDMCDGTPVNTLAERCCSMGLSTKQSHDGIYNFKETKKVPHYRADAMQIKCGIKNNILKNLPRNVPY